ncbi:M15 family metallopeptidase [uncultured Dubosiella sp.]|uniref:M15 family metallopeptidase n=1 Tax=uncultured Dubosiella sp. TaxID=1937011 RepID=UPI0026321C54|nr:M15 family metallopeptidase [uncultured Dubosiella sp.]
MKKIFVLLVCIGMVAGLCVGGFMMFAQTASNEKNSESRTDPSPKYSTRESVYADANPDLDEKEIRKRVALDLDKAPYVNASEVSDPNDPAVLVNAYHTISDSYEPEDLDVISVEEDGMIALRKEAADAYRQLEEAARADNVDLHIANGYLPADAVHSTYEQLVKENGESVANQVFADAPYSDYRTGLGADIYIGSAENRQNIAQDPGYAWLVDHLHEYGYIIRYEQDKSVYTLMGAQPWHIRYVGKEAAKAMHDDSLCLEEYSIR